MSDYGECLVCLLPTEKTDSYCSEWCATKTPEEAERIRTNELQNRQYEQWRVEQVQDADLFQPDTHEEIEKYKLRGG